MTPFAQLGEMHKQAAGPMSAFRAVGRMIPKLTKSVNTASVNAPFKAGWKELDVIGKNHLGKLVEKGSLGRHMRNLRDDAQDAVGTPRGSDERNWMASSIRNMRSSGYQHPLDKHTIYRGGAVQSPRPVAGISGPSTQDNLVNQAKTLRTQMESRTANPGFADQFSALRSAGVM